MDDMVAVVVVVVVVLSYCAGIRIICIDF